MIALFRLGVSGAMLFDNPTFINEATHLTFIIC
jgi:hypothetical protein